MAMLVITRWYQLFFSAASEAIQIVRSVASRQTPLQAFERDPAFALSPGDVANPKEKPGKPELFFKYGEATPKKSVWISWEFQIVCVNHIIIRRTSKGDLCFPPIYPLVNVYITMENKWKSPFFIGKSTISTGQFSIAMLVYQRVSY